VNKPFRKLAAAASIVAVGAAILVAAGSASKASSAKSQPSTGGTLVAGWENDFGFTSGFDPTGEYLGEAWGILNNLLVRTLVGTNHVAGAAGNKLVPDLATSVPKPTNGGKTYTFKLKSGVKFGPPVNRAVTSTDIKYALQRLANPKNGGQYAFYYSSIQGWAAGAKGQNISGIQTPNPSTLVINLTQPRGDFLYALAMPATAPIPVEVGKCFAGKPLAYGRNIVSTGPYMIEGADANADLSSCGNVKPWSGFDAKTKLFLVRNPNYDPKTDTKAARENFPDKFEFVVNANADDIFAKIEAGEYATTGASSIPPQTLRKYSTSSDLKKYLYQNSGDRTWYLTMNFTQPPFDDVKVRRAMNWVMDKHGLVQAWGGPLIGKVANHIIPDPLLGNLLAEYAPYKTPGDRGSVAKAKAALKGSKYDTEKNGMCSAPECRGVLLLADTRDVDEKMLPVIQASAKKIGITFEVRTIEGAYPTIQTPSKNVPLAERPGWGKDYADPYTFFSPLFDGRTIIPSGNTNYSLVGITPAKCKELKITGNCSGVPSVNADLDKCAALVGQAHTACYAALDRKLMTNVVPWVPYLWSYVTRITSKDVTKYEFDQAATTPAYAHLAVQ
jgi:peptide/nickel transport system substrate-binding protein